LVHKLLAVALVLDILAAALVCGGLVVLGSALRAVPVVTILGSLLLFVLVGLSLFIYLAGRPQTGLSRRRIALIVLFVMVMGLATGLAIWLVYCSSALAG